METSMYTQQKEKEAQDQDSNAQSEKLVKEAAYILGSRIESEAAKKNNLLFYLAMALLMILCIATFTAGETYNQSLLAGSGIIFSLLLIRRFSI